MLIPVVLARGFLRAAFVGTLLLLFLPSPVHAASCTNPFWANTLRCRNEPVPASIDPQPPPSEPSAASQIREFTRVDLDADPSVRCLDGTVPILYVDAAEGPPSNDWILSVSGGGSCSAGIPGAGGLVDGQACLDAYSDPTERDEMSTFDKPATRNLGTGAGGSTGILSPDLAANPVFARFNRVRIQKCSYDRYNGRSTRAAGAIHPTIGPITYQLTQQGQRIVSLTLSALRNGLAYDLYEDDGSGGVVKTVDGAALPMLSAASRILVVGHSGGAHGLMHNIDRLADELAGWPFAGELKVVLDANFLVALDSEAAFSTSAPLGSDLYSGITSGDSAPVAPTSGSYDASFYSSPSSLYVKQYAAWAGVGDGLDAIFDASCVADHPSDPWRCIDRFHVLFNHISTPLFIREDFADPNFEHTASGNGHVVQWGEWGTYPHCPLAGFGATCPPLIGLTEHRARLLEQLERFSLDAEADSDGSTAAPSRYFFLPECGRHAGAYADDSFFDARIDSPARSASYRQLLEEFVLSAPATGSVVSLVEGLDGATSSCAGEVGVPTGVAPLGLGVAITMAGAALLWRRARAVPDPTNAGTAKS